MDAVLKAAGLSTNMRDALFSEEPWREWAVALDAPLEQAIKPCARPTPRPPVALRPTSLSVTEITTWLRNPYAIYARHILRLEKLEELDSELDASDRGVIIHEVMEAFSHLYSGDLPDDAEETLLALGQKAFAKTVINPRLYTFWWARFVTIAKWFIETEIKRRRQGISLLSVESRGKMVMEGFTLKGRADRVDRLPSGALAIIDYKTGSTPTKTEVLSGIEPQLQLLALMARCGGFEGIAPAETGVLEYWALKGGRGGCKITSFDEEIDALVRQAETGLKRLIEAFANPLTPYEAVPRPRFQARHNAYAHLSRLAEWGRIVEE
jgi:ATP-dependent helicase/nuclease subunit B